jgi:hypothetical protein
LLLLPAIILLLQVFKSIDLNADGFASGTDCTLRLAVHSHPLYTLGK